MHFINWLETSLLIDMLCKNIFFIFSVFGNYPKSDFFFKFQYLEVIQIDLIIFSQIPLWSWKHILYDLHGLSTFLMVRDVKDVACFGGCALYILLLTMEH